jgi:SAM-dependent methyltransferase
MSTMVHQQYGEPWDNEFADEFTAVVRESLHPRGPEMLVGRFGDLGVRAGELVLLIGGRDVRSAIDLVRRYDVRVLVIDPVAESIARVREKATEFGLADRITTDLGQLEHLPLSDGAIDHIWCRDILSHLDIPRALTECARVLRPWGGMLNFQTFGTTLLEPNEARQLASALAIQEANLAQTHFEQSARQASFRIEVTDPVDSEWREREVEDGDPRITNDLLTIARMRRTRRSLVQRYGERRYQEMYVRALGGIYELLGKLCPVVHLMRKNS